MRAISTVAVIGSGISGLSAAWLLSRRYEVRLFERDPRAGGHSHTVDAPVPSGPVPVDTGFIVYNEAAYPNLSALFHHLGVKTAPSSMSFSVSLDRGRYEYSGTGLTGLFGQPSNLLDPDHWRMTADILQFFRRSRELLAERSSVSLGDYLAENGYSRAFVERHILPMAAAIWSTPAAEVMAFPAASFVRFFDNHGLLQAYNQPLWRTVVGGSRNYVRLMTESVSGGIELDAGITHIVREPDGIAVHARGGTQRFDACVLATHADEALTLLQDADADERRLLGAFRYSRNRAVLHTDASMMPKRRRLWSSWNYLGSGQGNDRTMTLSYWMNNLQPLGAGTPDIFVTLNPPHDLSEASSLQTFEYEHPNFDAAAMAAQRELWQLQGSRRTWFAGAYFGYGFHEDGLQAGLAAAEDIGGVRRPWKVENESGRIHLGAARQRSARPVLEAAE